MAPRGEGGGGVVQVFLRKHIPSKQIWWPASETPLKWRFTSWPMMAQH